MQGGTIVNTDDEADRVIVVMARAHLAVAVRRNIVLPPFMGDKLQSQSDAHRFNAFLSNTSGR